MLAVGVIALAIGIKLLKLVVLSDLDSYATKSDTE